MALTTRVGTTGQAKVREGDSPLMWIASGSATIRSETGMQLYFGLPSQNRAGFKIERTDPRGTALHQDGGCRRAGRDWRSNDAG